MPSNSNLTFWIKDGEYLLKQRYKAFAKMASRQGRKTAELLEELGYQNTFDSSYITGRPKKSIPSQPIGRTFRIKNGKLQ